MDHRNWKALRIVLPPKPFQSRPTSGCPGTPFDIPIIAILRLSKKYFEAFGYRLSPYPDLWMSSVVTAGPTQKAPVEVLEIQYDEQPIPKLASLIAEAMPSLQALKLRQRTIWCDNCQRRLMPRFDAPCPVLVYPDGRDYP